MYFEQHELICVSVSVLLNEEMLRPCTATVKKKKKVLIDVARSHYYVLIWLLTVLPFWDQ